MNKCNSFSFLLLIVCDSWCQSIDTIVCSFKSNYNERNSNAIYNEYDVEFQKGFPISLHSSMLHVIYEENSNILSSILNKNKANFIITFAFEDSQFVMTFELIEQVKLYNVTYNYNKYMIEFENNVSWKTDNKVGSLQHNYLLESKEFKNLIIGINQSEKNRFYNYSLINEQHLDSQTAYDVGFNFKCFSTFLEYDLVSDEKLSYDSMIGTFISELDEVSGSLKIRQLINYSSGFPNKLMLAEIKNINGRDSFELFTMDSFKICLFNLLLGSKPGHSFSYSNFCSATIDNILSEESEKSNEELLIDKLRKVGIKHITIQESDVDHNLLNATNPFGVFEVTC